MTTTLRQPFAAPCVASAAAPPTRRARDPRYHGIWTPGIALFSRLRFRSKAALIMAALVLPLILQLGWQLNAQYENLQQSRATATRQHVEVAHGIMAWAEGQERAGRMTREQAQALAREEIASLRYDGSEYFWINDMHPRMVVHPTKPELNGSDISTLKDPNGKALFVDMAALVNKQGSGFVGYQWPKPGSDKPVDKVSYVKGFAPWGWIVGSGVYIGDLHDDLRRSVVSTLALFVPTFLLGIYLYICFHRVVVGGQNETRRHLEAMTAGDLTTAPVPRGSDEMTEVMATLQKMQRSLRGIVGSVREASDGILRSSSEVAAGAVELSSRTEQSAANLAQTAASMEQINATVKNTSEHTAEAARVARNNAEVAANGGQAMLEVAAKMKGIQDSSVRMVDIIGTIESISFQTNLLALNAAVEAARAGPHGRGFAVVAAEVRSLAKRSSDAAREVKTLIDSSEEQVRSGAGVVQTAGDTMQEIIRASQRVDLLLSQIAVGAGEQAQGLAQIGLAVHELDQVTQQNAALVEETAAASTMMKDQAAHLSSEVSRFKLPPA